MKKDTKEIIGAIFFVGWIILTVLGRWYVGFIFLILYIFLLKTKEEKTGGQMDNRMGNVPEDLSDFTPFGRRSGKGFLWNR